MVTVPQQRIKSALRPPHGRGRPHFDDVALNKLDKPGPIWAAIRKQANPPAVQRAAPVRFTINVSITGPAPRPGVRRSVADLVKPLLDGIICAYHRDSTPTPDAAAARLSAAASGLQTC